MHFSWEINIGTVCQIFIILFSVLGAFRKISGIEEKVNIMYVWFENQIIIGNGRSKRKAASGD